MAHVIPFKALRPQKDIVKAVASYPYDVLSVEEAQKLAAGNPYSFLHVEKGEINLPPGEAFRSDYVHEQAKAYMEDMIKKEILFQDDQPCYYIYGQKLGEHTQYGIVACFSAEEYEKGLIKKHELTRTDKELDRTRHVDIVNAHTGPVFLTFKSQPSLHQIIASIIVTSPEYDYTADDGIRHTAWIIKDSSLIRSIHDEFKSTEALYIADGHHRAAAGASVARSRRANNPHHRGNEEYNFFLAVAFPHNELRIMDYNRVVKDLNGLTKEMFMEKIKEYFSITEPFKEKTPVHAHEFGMYLEGLWYKLTAKRESFPQNHPIDSLDVSILQKNLLSPLLGIQDPRTDKRIDFVGGIRGMGELEKLVDHGKFQVAFSLCPTTLDELIRVADAGLIMPPKSTWFEPKLRSGIFVHPLD